ncbi:5411_t:CDS:2 [Ambispora gerdemannii]|uniref:5411_t:CDS:1 n=1 Tax=Ambispora gerdemannii TaxID=144530 RepID=A0A9N9C1P2_9GLOM|nr:5411_t:CDS:2 [Ambispora gerdemannii]
MNADESVACGAAIKAAMHSVNCPEKLADTLVLDVIPYTIGIETAGVVMTPIIKRNTTVPLNKTRDNNFLGKFPLEGIPPAPRGAPQIESTFDVNNNGTLKFLQLINQPVENTPQFMKKMVYQKLKN